MSLSIRLEPQLARELERAAARSGKAKSQIVKDGLREYLARLAERKTPYQLGADLFAKGQGSGQGNLSDKTEIRRRIRERVRAENHR
jgi:RHH-type rel operon transcriptional repressor/antitoxin RelB